MEYPEPLCDNYGSINDVYAARVINATCSCIPANSYHDTNSGYSYYENTTNVSCVSAALDSGEVVSETVVRTTCDVYDSFYILPCNNILADFVGKPYEGVACPRYCIT